MSTPQSRLYLKLTQFAGNHASVACVEAALQAGDVAALLTGAEIGNAPNESAKGLVSVAHANDVALIVDENFELAKTLGADGVQVNASLEDYTKARSVLGDDAIVGIGPTSSRHAAMQLAEAGASYVSFSDDPSDPDGLSAWWAQVMEVPCVLHLREADGDALRAAQAGIEFISPQETIWQSPEEAAQAVKHLNAQIAKAGLAA